MSKKPKFIVAGYTCVDITPQFPQGEGIVYTREIFAPGHLTKVGAATMSAGGSVTNTGIAIHKFGGDVDLVGKIGRDDFGRIVEARFREQGVEPKFVISDEDSTGYTVCIAAPGIDRIFFVNGGANDTMTADDLLFSPEDRGAFFHFGYPTLMKSFYLKDGEETVKLYRKAKEAGCITSMDTTFVDANSPEGKADWPEIFAEVLPYVDIFTPSFEEACALLMPEKYEELQKKAGDDDLCMHLSISEDVEPLAEKILSMGSKVLLLKCGAAGIYLRSGSEESLKKLDGALDAEAWANISYFAKSYKPDRIASGTGAGDTAIAAFLYSAANGFDPIQCVKNAAGSGSMCITAYDSLSGLLPIEDLMKRIDAGWEIQEFIRP